jgi:hypothetical protein
VVTRERAKACLQGDSVLQTIERGIKDVNCDVGDYEHAANQLTFAIHLHNTIGKQNLLVPCTAAAAVMNGSSGKSVAFRELKDA